MILQLDEETAELTACRMEHVIDNQSLEKLLLLFDFIYKCPRAGKDWVEAFLYDCSSGKLDPKKCKRCLDDCHARHQ